MADEVMNKKPIIKYLLNGEYKEATVADVGDLSQLKTTVKTTLVDAINALFNGEGSSGSIPEDVQNDINDLQDAVDGLNNGLSGLGDAFENQKVENDQKLQDLLDEINKNINDTKTVIEQTITDVTNEYQTKVDQVTNELNDAKGNIATTIDDLSKVKDELTNIDLNIKNISVVIDEINLQLTSKVEKSDFDLLEAEVKKNTTQITQNAEEIALKASQESLNVATGRIAQNEAQIKVNADKIESKVSQEEVREEIEKIDRFGKNLFHRTREWHNSEWNLNGFTVSSDTYMRCHILTISENNKPVTQIVDNLVVGDTYNISVYAKADNTTAKVYGKISGVTEPIKMVRVGSSDDTLVGTDFYRLNGSFVATDTTLDIGFIFQSLATGKKGYLSAGKLEHSALPSDWQPNADDTYEAVIRNESAINQVADEIELVVETTEQQGKDIENNKSSIDVLNDSITLQTEKITEIDGVVKEQGAQLEIAQDQISQKVSQTDIDQSIADIDIDTKNRILNSDFQREFENWNEVNSGFKIVEKDGVKYAHIERTGLTAVQIASMSSDKFLVKPSDRLMFSFDFIVDDLSKLDNKTLFTVELFDIKDVRVDFKNYTISDLHNESVSNGEIARLYSSWEINREDVAKGRIKYNLYQNGSVYFTKAMLQSGQMNSTEWDSAPEDAYIIRGKLESSIEQNAKEIALKVSQVDFDVMGDSVKENTANIQIANDSITNTVKELEKTNEKVSANETEIAQTKEQISLKADSLEVDNLEGRMSEAEAQIVLNTEGITQTVKDIETVANTAESIKNIADQAKANADKANSSINEMGQDNKLSPVEKKAISTEWETIKSEYATIKGQADKYSVTSTTYTTAYNSLTSYITTLKLGETTSTTIAPDVFRTQFKTYYSEKVKILNAISDKVKELGDATAQNVKSWAESEIKQTADSIKSTVKSYTDEQVSGVSTIYTHNAWSWSKDGTDRFTTVYPRENLTLNSSFDDATNFNGWSSVYGKHEIVDGVYKKTFTMLHEASRLEKSVVINEVGYYIFSALIKTTETVSWRTHSGVLVDPVKTDYPPTDGYQLHQFVFKAETTGTKLLRGYMSQAPIGTVVEIAYEKLEKANSFSDKATIYTPAPSEDSIGAYMKYMGTCSNHSETAPTEPSKYIWQPNPEIPLSKAWMTGENGEGFSTEKIGENLLLNTSNFQNTSNWGENEETTIKVEDNCLSVYKATSSAFRGVHQTIPIPDGYHGKKFYLSTTAKNASDSTALSNSVIIRYLNASSALVSQQNVYGAPNLTTDFQHLKYDVATVPSDTAVTKMRIIFKYGREGTVCHVLHKNFKASFEDTATPYIPSPIDDPINCIPKYLGTSPKPSDKWTDYTWSLNPDYLSNLTEIAQDTADNANNALSEMSKDTVLSPLEKTSLLKEWTTIQSDYPLVKAQGDKYKVSTTTLTNTYSVLNNYVPPLLNNKMNENSTIKPDIFNANFKNYYDAKLNVLNGVNNVIQGNVDGIEVGGRNYFSIEAWKKKPSFNVSNIEAIKISLIPNSQYTLSTNIPNRTDGATCDLFLLDSSAIPNSGKNGVALNKPRTITTLADGIVIVAMRGYEFESGNWWAMLSKGNKALDWSPAPEDVDQQITTVKTWAESQFEITNKNIELSVKEVTETITDVNDKVDNIEVGGRNLLQEKNIKPNGTTNINDGQTPKTYTITAKAGAGGTWGVGFETINKDVLVPWGRTLITSCEVKVPKAIAWNVDINNYPITGTEWASNDNDAGGPYRKDNKKTLPANEWVKCWWSYPNTNSKNTAKVDLYDVSKFGIVMQNETSDLTFQIRKIKSELGTVPSDWSPAPEDTQSAIDKAQSDANKANSTLSDYAKDTILSPLEKTGVATEWEGIQVEFTTINTQANSYGINVGYSSAFNSLKSYIEPLLNNNMTTNSTIKPDEFKGKFKTYYDTKTKCLTEINKKIQGNVDSLGNYTAYANSPDGTVDFIPVYPGENLLLNSDFSYLDYKDKWQANGNVSISKGEKGLVVTNTVTTNNNWPGAAYTHAIPLNLKAKDYFTVMAKVRNISGEKNDFRFGIHFRKDGAVTSQSWSPYGISISSEETTVKFNFATPTDADEISLMIVGKANTAFSFELLEVKLELGNNPNPIYTPSPQDDPVKAHMQYIGYSIKDSNDYKDYTWQVNPEVPLKKAWKTGENGEGFSLEKIGENLLIGNKEFIAENTNYTTPPYKSAGLLEIDIEKLNKERCLTVSAYISVKNSQRIAPTGAFRIGYEGTITLSDGTTGYVGVWHNGVIGETFSGRVTKIYHLPDGITATKVQNSGGIYHQQNGEYLEVSQLKVEYGNVSDPVYIPSPQDDPVNCYPKYLGTSPNGGEKWTDYTWALNPDYVAAVADNHISNVKEILESQIDITAESILNTVSATYQTTEGANVTEEELRSLIEQTSSSWGVSLKQIQKELNTVNGDLVEEVKTRSDYMRFYSGTNTPILEIGTQSTSGSSAIKLIITNNSIGFISGEVDLDNPMKNALAYFEADKFKINKGIIVESLRVGNHEMQKMDNGHTIFTFVG